MKKMRNIDLSHGIGTNIFIKKGIIAINYFIYDGV